ncbi:Mce family protein [Gordonia araii NBRC 100433]|uniref:Mce family protein n=1 Tax=Gordonia araii NBRC 100433 TaxID=1073574 RepID=G7H1J2_9ACTN|nr:MlaD family protein [Gordonia araii]NNG97774.1 MCE family protein [Gordonia araii NBRC 100433]GAB09717.1 Mce family protein [Gordonia araii NBRC 100433]
MKITNFVRSQLIIFAVVTVVAMLAMAIIYIRIPQMFGVGVYRVNLDLPTTGGLYQNANVSFRGVNVGKVDSVTLTDKGVRARLTIDSNAKIPENSQASIRSVSAVGEQFVEFLPPEKPDSSSLGNNATVVTDDVPVEISTMLDQADRLLTNVGDSKLRAVMDEAFKAFNGTGEQLQRLLDSMTLLTDDAYQNSDAMIALVREAGDVLSTQRRTSDAVRSWTSSMTRVTDQLRANKPEITGILAKGPGVTSDTGRLFESMQISLPLLVDNLGTSAKTMAVYHPNMRQILVLYPRLLDILITAVNTGDVERYGANADFALGFQDPGTCTVGFLPFDQWRPGSATTARELPPGLLCRVPQDQNLAVRGSRNFPCVEFPGRRAPTPEECRTGYKPNANQNVPFPNGLPFGLKWQGPGRGPGVAPARHQGAGATGSVVPATPSQFRKDGNQPAVYSTTYDPKTGDYVGPDGKTYNAGLGRDSRGKTTTWQQMINPTTR